MSTPPRFCVDCGRDMDAGAPHTADCISAIYQDAQDGDTEALSLLVNIVRDMIHRTDPRSGRELQTVLDKAGCVRAYEFARNDRRFARA